MHRLSRQYLPRLVGDPPVVAAEQQAVRLLAEAQPRYATVAATLAAEILQGSRPVGELLPTEQDLALAFAVSRSTIREALRRLRELGLVAGAQGVGTRVIADRPRSSYQLAAHSVADVMGYAGPTILDVLVRDWVAVDAAMATRLGLEPGGRWRRVRGIRHPMPRGSAPPISRVEIYVAEPFAAMADRSDIVTVPAYRLISQHLGVAVAEVRQEITAIALDEAQAEALQAAPGSPGLHILRHFLAVDGRTIEATVNIHSAADRFAYTLRLGAPEDAP